MSEVRNDYVTQFNSVARWCVVCCVFMETEEYYILNTGRGLEMIHDPRDDYFQLKQS